MLVIRLHRMEEHLGRKHLDLIKLYEEHGDEVHDLKRHCVEEILGEIKMSMDVSEQDVKWVEDFLDDDGEILFVMLDRPIN